MIVVIATHHTPDTGCVASSELTIVHDGKGNFRSMLHAHSARLAVQRMPDVKQTTSLTASKPFDAWEQPVAPEN